MKISLICLLFCSFTSLAQLEIYPTSPTYMENGDLFGPDYEIFNAEFSGSAYAYAYAQFNGVNSNLGLKRGFVMTTGMVAHHNYGILGPNNFTDAGVDLSTGGYPLLSSLIGGTATSDAAVLSFDFIPHTDSLVFNYSFGSEEYYEYVGSSFSDVAAIFLLGPGIPSPQNILTIGGVPVNINTVHDAVSNQFGTFPGENQSFIFSNPLTSDTTAIEYDAFTINTEVRYEGLQVDSVYHMIIAIADAFDGIYDSGLFIEACETCVPTLGMKDLENEFVLSPNPAFDLLNVQINGQHDYKIINGLGQEVLTGKLDGSTNIDCSSLPSGLYLFQLNSGEIKRFVKR